MGEPALGTVWSLGLTLIPLLRRSGNEGSNALIQ